MYKFETVINAVVNHFCVECDRTCGRLTPQCNGQTSDVYDGLRLRTRLNARILVAILWR
ncbi:hypothetical protein ACEYW6_03665 [Nostoc sp. UIC 10607]|uniref:hypothetical protein n=1 Tax=Nostoc sp. UIC 10607 TaxID=3045935 RepID=UPI0039A2CD1B